MCYRRNTAERISLKINTMRNHLRRRKPAEKEPKTEAAADALTGLKKADLVKSAEERLAGKGWLPAFLQLTGK